MTHRILITAFLLVGSVLIAPARAADADGDGVDDANDVCCGTPTGILVNSQGRPVGDLDGDCDCDLVDYWMFQQSFTGPLSGCCALNSDCAAGEYCAKATGDCAGGGTCTDMPASCPLIYAPVCGCDGTTYTNACLAAQVGVNIATNGVCSLSCTDNSECGSADYCAKPAGDCNTTGACTAKPLACPDVYIPVCGCDGQTYTNECQAREAGVNVAYAGVCIGCVDNNECDVSEFCDKTTGDCNGVGACAPLPGVCPLAYIPVCGCDGQTYTNECYADQAGINVAQEGECPAVCTANIDCGAGEFCDKAAGDCGGSGTCASTPASCLGIVDPVCGCDGQTYQNACYAAQAEVSVDHSGACTVACTANAQCGSGEYCAKATGDCNGNGLCDDKPLNCPAIFNPVCGCDNVSYNNACAAAQAGANVSYAGLCTSR
ncbi:MAG TPA: Kazal-type serine protease inhibitor domain-containing protein [Phycisphaerae bacterium]|nr:hypothetical protein [Phycisphaerales bacterium]HRX83874.1 Kazal-type serine protease inhibitor domain-containing protein [Phycisphaerae bacterium]